MKADLTLRAAVIDGAKFSRLSQEKQLRIQERVVNTYIVALLDAGIDLDHFYGKQGVRVACVHGHNVNPDGSVKSEAEAENYACEGCMEQLAQDGEV